MPSGPDHYREAERILTAEAVAPNIVVIDIGALAAAQVHATLALAAAYAMSHAGFMPVPDCEAWETAVSAAAAVRREGDPS